MKKLLTTLISAAILAMPLAVVSTSASAQTVKAQADKPAGMKKEKSKKKTMAKKKTMGKKKMKKTA
jgi:Ni/Co efflux regulator RcnB